MALGKTVHPINLGKLTKLTGFCLIIFLFLSMLSFFSLFEVEVTAETVTPELAIFGNSNIEYNLEQYWANISPTGFLTSFDIINGGSGYTTPHLDITGGGGSGATAVARVSQGVVTGLIVTNSGSGYTSVPTVTLRDPSPRAKGAIVIAITSIPKSLTVWTDGNFYYANSTRNEIFLGGPSNIKGVNGSSFASVVTASGQAVHNVTFLAGKFVQDSSIICSNNTVFTGQGNSTLVQQVAEIGVNEYGFFCYQVTNVTISHLWLDGNRENQVKTGDMGRHGLLSMFSSNILISGCTITNFSETGFDPCWTTNSTIENSILSGNGDGDIWIDISTCNFTVRNNTISSLDGKTGLGIAAVFFDDDGNHTGIITNNTIIGNFSSYGLELYWGSGMTKPHGITVSNNTIIGGNGYQSGIWVYGMSNCTIEGNIIKNNTGTVPFGILLTNSDRIMIRNNIVSYNSGFGVLTGFPSNNNIVINNDLRYNGQGAIADDVAQTHDIVITNIGVDI